MRKAILLKHACVASALPALVLTLVVLAGCGGSFQDAMIGEPFFGVPAAPPPQPCDPNARCCCSSICGNVTLDVRVDPLDFLALIGEYGQEIGSTDKHCLDGPFNQDGYFDAFDLLAWDWGYWDPATRLHLCSTPLTEAQVTVSAPAVAASQIQPATPMPCTAATIAGRFVIAGKGGREEAFAPDDVLYGIDAEGALSASVPAPCPRASGMLLTDDQDQIYQVNLDRGIVRLSDGQVILEPTTLSTTDPRSGQPVKVLIGLHVQNDLRWGRPVLDATFDADGDLYVVPVVIQGEAQPACTAAARLRLTSGAPELVMLYGVTPIEGTEAFTDGLREIELDQADHVYVTAAHQVAGAHLRIFHQDTGRLIEDFALENPAPIALLVENNTRIYLGCSLDDPTGVQSQLQVYSWQPGELILRRTIPIQAMGHITGIARDPASGLLYIVGFSMPQRPNRPLDETDLLAPPFYVACMAACSPEATSCWATELTCGDLALPLAIVCTSGEIPQCNLTVEIAGEGRVDPPTGLYPCGSELTLHAAATETWRFDHWEMNGEAFPYTPLTVALDQDTTVRAVFARIQHRLTIETQGPGVVTADLVGPLYDHGTTVTLTAAGDPVVDYRFDRWEGDLTGSVNPATIVIDQDQTVRAVFLPPPPPLGAEAGEDKTIAPGGSCTLQATAAGGVPPYAYTWSPAAGLDASTTDQPTASPTETTVYTLTVTDADGQIASDRVTVTVAPVLSANAGPDQSILQGGACIVEGSAAGGSGTITYQWSPANGLDNPAIAQPVASPETTTVYTLTATDELGQSAQDPVTVEVVPLHNVSITVQGGGSVALDPPGGVYAAGITVTLTAMPDAAYSWHHWEGDLTGSANPATITVDSPKAITAVFAPIPAYGSTIAWTGVTLNGADVTDLNHPQVTVLPGASLSGTIRIQVDRQGPAGAFFPVAGTVSWDRTEEAQISSHLAPGIHSVTYNLATTAPTTPGNYWILVTAGPLWDIQELLGCDHRPEHGGPADGPYGNGNDVWDWSQDQCNQAFDNRPVGCIFNGEEAWWLARAIKVVVVETPSSWATSIGGPGNDLTYDGVSALPDGSVCITGQFYGDTMTLGAGEPNETVLTGTAGSEIFLARLNADGTLAWATKGIGTGLEDCTNTIDTSSEGACVIGGGFYESFTLGLGEPNQTTLISGGTADAFLARYDANGSLAWARKGTGPWGVLLYDVAFLSDGSVLAAGVFDRSAAFGVGEPAEVTLSAVAGSTDFFVAKYDSDGNLLWARSDGGSGLDQGYILCSLSDGSFYLGGNFEGTMVLGLGEANETSLTATDTFDVFFARYNADGSLAWAKSVPGTGYAAPSCLRSLSDGSLVIMGTLSGTSTFGQGEATETTLTSAGSRDVFVAKYSAEGNLVWAVRAGGPRSDEVFRGAVLSDGSVLLAGAFSSETVFGSGESNQTTLTSAGMMDIFVAKLDADGTLAWVTGVGSAGDERARAMAVLPDGSPVIAGDFHNLLVFGADTPAQTTLIPAGGTDVFIARFNPDGSFGRVP